VEFKREGRKGCGRLTTGELTKGRWAILEDGSKVREEGNCCRMGLSLQPTIPSERILQPCLEDVPTHELHVPPS